MNKEINYLVGIAATVLPDIKKGTSKFTKLSVVMNEGGIYNFRDGKGELNEAGLKAQTAALIKGLVASVYDGDKAGVWDFEDHLSLIIEKLMIELADKVGDGKSLEVKNTE